MSTVPHELARKQKNQVRLFQLACYILMLHYISVALVNCYYIFSFMIKSFNVSINAMRREAYSSV